MRWYQVHDLFKKYNWQSAKDSFYVWSIVLEGIRYIAHIGGHSDNDLNVCFSTKGGEVLPIVIRDLETLETYLAPI